MMMKILKNWKLTSVARVLIKEQTFALWEGNVFVGISEISKIFKTFHTHPLWSLLIISKVGLSRAKARPKIWPAGHAF